MRFQPLPRCGGRGDQRGRIRDPRRCRAQPPTAGERADLDRGADGGQALRGRLAVAAQVRRRRARGDRRQAGSGAAARGAPRVRRRLTGPLWHRGARRRAACVRWRAQHLAQGLRAAAGRGLRPRHSADRQRARAAPGRPRRACPRQRRAGGRAGRHHATRAAARGRGCRPDRRAGHRGRRPYR